MIAKEPSVIELLDLQKKKLWHQLSIKLLDYVQNPNVINKPDTLKQLYNDFVLPAQDVINRMTYMKIISFIIKQFADNSEAIKFLKSIDQTVADNKEALVLCKVLQGEIFLNSLSDNESTLKILDECEELLKYVEDISSVYSRYNLLLSNYYFKIGKPAEYFRACLKYLETVDLLSLSTEEQIGHAYTLSLAALISMEIYDMGILLQHPILQSLKYNQNEWLIDLLEIFNTGDIEKFKVMSPKWSSINDLVVHKTDLRKKIAILCLVQMVDTNMPNRDLTFEEIAKGTQLPIKEVEILVMKAFSLGLVKGTIDEIDQTVSFTWVKPRVVLRSQIDDLVRRFDHWIWRVQHVKGDIMEAHINKTREEDENDVATKFQIF